MFGFGSLIWWFGLVRYLLLGVWVCGCCFVGFGLRISLIVLVRARYLGAPSYCLVCLLIVLWVMACGCVWILFELLRLRVVLGVC